MKEAIDLAVRGLELPPEIMTRAMLSMMKGEVESSQIGALLAALATKGETVSEVVAAVKVMRGLMKIQPLPNNEIWVDVVGTGGDGANLFNISTTSVMIAAAGGVNIAKHGNISVTSKSGSADLLRFMGMNLELSPEKLTSVMKKTNCGFMFAPQYHSLMQNVAPIRRAIGIRTLFNLLGPLANPANVKHHVLGVYDRKWLRVYAEVLKELGSQRALIVHSEDGLDEFSVSAINYIAELNNGQIKEYELNPIDLGINYSNLLGLKVNSCEESFSLIKSVLTTNNPSIAVDILVLNAAAIFYISEKCDSLIEGMKLAKEIICNKYAWEKLNEIIHATQE